MDHLARQLALAFRNKRPQILRHFGLLSKCMKNFMQKELSNALDIVNPMAARKPAMAFIFR
jgi:hypothetical protein